MIKQSLIHIAFFGCLINSYAQEPKRVHPKQFYALIQQHDQALIVDVRSSEKFAQYRIENAVPAPEKRHLMELAKLIPKADTLFVYCEKELRSKVAVELLDSIGYTHIYELKGGLISWRRNGLPLDEVRLTK